MEKNSRKNQFFWFVSGLTLGLTLISLGHAAIPKRATPLTQAPAPVSEIKGGKVGSPNLEQDYMQLNSLESKYAESFDQQQRIKGATSQIAHSSTPKKIVKKKRIQQ